MTQTSIAPYPRFKAFYPGTGNPLSGGQLWTLQPGTSGTGFLKATYTDSTGQVLNTNPVVLDANGEADVWLSGYTKLVLQDANGVQVWSRDNVSSMPSTSAVQVGEWIPQVLVFTYLSATQFTTPGDQTALFTPGERVQATVSAGTVYGTVQTSVAAGNPVLTTVTVTWDTGSLDSGLSGIATGIITSSSHISLPYGSLGLFTGEIRMFSGSVPPSGWLVCDGSAVSRTTYAILFSVVTISTTGTLVSGSAIVTLPSTSGMGVGMPISGTGVPPGTVIASVDSGTQIHMSQNASASGTGVALLIAPYGAGDGSTTFNLPDMQGRMVIGTGQTTPPIWKAGTPYSLGAIVKPTASYNYVYDATSGPAITFSWANGSPGFDTFTSSGVNITSAINTAGTSESASASITGLTVGDLYELTLSGTLTSGQAPNLTSTGASPAISQGLIAGAQTIQFYATSTTVTLTFTDTAAAHWAAGSVVLSDFTSTYAGTSGATEPSWPTTIGGTVSDGTITWTCQPKWVSRTLGQEVGSPTHTLTTAELPADIPYTDPGHDHTTTYVTGGSNPAIGAAANYTNAATVTGSSTTGITVNPAGGGAHTIMNPAICVQFIIKI